MQLMLCVLHTVYFDIDNVFFYSRAYIQTHSHAQYQGIYKKYRVKYFANNDSIHTEIANN